MLVSRQSVHKFDAIIEKHGSQTYLVFPRLAASLYVGDYHHL
jgi:hypothetical protein